MELYFEWQLHSYIGGGEFCLYTYPTHSWCIISVYNIVSSYLFKSHDFVATCVLCKMSIDHSVVKNQWNGME